MIPVALLLKVAPQHIWDSLKWVVALSLLLLLVSHRGFFPQTLSTESQPPGICSSLNETGSLKGADYLIRVPDNWNRVLVVMCARTIVFSQPSSSGLCSWLQERAPCVGGRTYFCVGEKSLCFCWFLLQQNWVCSERGDRRYNQAGSVFP